MSFPSKIDSLLHRAMRHDKEVAKPLCYRFLSEYTPAFFYGNPQIVCSLNQFLKVRTVSYFRCQIALFRQYETELRQIQMEWIGLQPGPIILIIIEIDPRHDA